MLLRQSFIAVVLFGVLVRAASAQVVHEATGEYVRSRSQPGAGKEPDLDRVAALIVSQTNAFRKEQGRAPLRVNAELGKATHYFADYLARTNKFSHTADDSQPWERTKKFGYAHCIVAENIAYEYDSAGFSSEDLAQKLMHGWEHSPGHRKNLLDPDLTEIGVTVAQSPETGYYYAVQDFGRPQSAHVQFQFENDTDAAIRYQIGERTYTLQPHYTRTHEMCRPAPVTLRWTEEAKGEGLTLRPENGAHYDVRKDGAGRFQVKKQ
jgi:uncharacterized protein YkwD